MRQYLIHRKYYIAYLSAQQRVEAILDEHEKMLQKVQPKSPLAEHEREFDPSMQAGGNKIPRKAEDYAIEMEQKNIRERLKEAKEILEIRSLLLSQKEEEVRKSRDIYNVIYTAKWIDGKKPKGIIFDTGYSKSQVYSIINQIEKQIERQ